MCVESRRRAVARAVVESAWPGPGLGVSEAADGAWDCTTALPFLFKLQVSSATFPICQLNILLVTECYPFPLFSISRFLSDVS
jgi:hypothetical protein